MAIQAAFTMTFAEGGQQAVAPSGPALGGHLMTGKNLGGVQAEPRRGRRPDRAKNRRARGPQSPGGPPAG